MLAAVCAVCRILQFVHPHTSAMRQLGAVVVACIVNPLVALLVFGGVLIPFDGGVYGMTLRHVPPRVWQSHLYAPSRLLADGLRSMAGALHTAQPGDEPCIPDN